MLVFGIQLMINKSLNNTILLDLFSSSKTLHLRPQMSYEYFYIPKLFFNLNYITNYLTNITLYSTYTLLASTLYF